MAILTDIEDKIAELMQGMRVADGYNSDWGTSNIEDEAVVEREGRWPNGIIDLDYTIENLDETDSTCANEYKDETIMQIKVRVKVDKDSSQPKYTQRIAINNAIEDIKKCFGKEENDRALMGVGAIFFMWQGCAKAVRTNADNLQYYDLNTFWKLRWAVDRETGAKT
jgi:hypothetical protein